MDLDLAYCKIDNLCCMAYNENNDIADNKEYPDDQELCHGPDDMIDALETLKKAVNFLKEARYVLAHSDTTDGKTTSGRIITTDYGYVEDFFNAIEKELEQQKIDEEKKEIS